MNCMQVTQDSAWCSGKLGQQKLLTTGDGDVRWRWAAACCTSRESISPLCLQFLALGDAGCGMGLFTQARNRILMGKAVPTLSLFPCPCPQAPWLSTLRPKLTRPEPAPT